MFVAFWTIHRFAGFFNFHRPDEGWEYVATLSVIGVALAIAGPGQYSVDEALGIAGNLDEWTGLAIVAGGLLVLLDLRRELQVLGAHQAARGSRRWITPPTARAAGPTFGARAQSPNPRDAVRSS